MRGKVLRGPMTRRMTGITPAYAGKRIRHDGVIPPF